MWCEVGLRSVIKTLMKGNAELLSEGVVSNKQYELDFVFFKAVRLLIWDMTYMCIPYALNSGKDTIYQWTAASEWVTGITKI